MLAVVLLALLSLLAPPLSLLARAQTQPGGGSAPFVSAGFACPLSRQPAKSPGGSPAGACVWYQDSASGHCCSLNQVPAAVLGAGAEGAEGGGGGGGACRISSGGCADMFDLLRCRVCSGDQQSWVIGLDGRTGNYSGERLCANFADELLIACKGDELFREPKCIPFDDFSSGRELGEAMGFEVVDAGDCFNAGERRSPAGPALAVFWLAIVGFGAQMR